MWRVDRAHNDRDTVGNPDDGRAHWSRLLAFANQSVFEILFILFYFGSEPGWGLSSSFDFWSMVRWSILDNTTREYAADGERCWFDGKFEEKKEKDDFITGSGYR
jgi:hypothetical protein